MRKDPESAQKLLDSTVFFALLGSASIKTAYKHVDEIDPWCSVEGNWIDVIKAAGN